MTQSLASRFLSPRGTDFRVPLPELHHRGRMSSAYGENNPFWKSRLPEPYNDHSDTSPCCLVSHALSVTHCLVCKILHFRENTESPTNISHSEKLPLKLRERKLLHSFNFSLCTKMTVYQMAPRAAFGTNMNKSDGFKSCCSAPRSIIWSNELRHLARCTRLPRKWCKLWTPVTLVSEAYSTMPYPYSQDELAMN